MAPNAGSRLGPHEIVTAPGAGGMGEVYRARNPRRDRHHWLASGLTALLVAATAGLGAGQSRLSDAQPSDVRLWTAVGDADGGEYFVADGRPLFVRQSPPILRPDHTGSVQVGDRLHGFGLAPARLPSPGHRLRVRRVPTRGDGYARSAHHQHLPSFVGDGRFSPPLRFAGRLRQRHRCEPAHRALHGAARARRVPDGRRQPGHPRDEHHGRGRPGRPDRRHRAVPRATW